MLRFPNLGATGSNPVGRAHYLKRVKRMGTDCYTLALDSDPAHFDPVHFGT